MAAPFHHVRPLRTHLPGVQAIVTESARSFGRHTHGQFGLGVVMDGGQASHSCAGTVEALPGDCITVHPDEVHDGMPLGDRPRRWFMLYMDPDFVAGAAAAYEFARPVLSDARLATLLLRTCTALARMEADGLLVEQEGMRLLGLAAGRSLGRVEAPGRLRLARQLIDDCPSEQLSLGALAQAAGMDKFQLARALLAQGVPVVTAAADAGFADQSHLTRLFTRALGITPAAYRRAFS